MNSFEIAFAKKVSESYYHYYGADNHDALRFGPYRKSFIKIRYYKAINKIKKKLGYGSNTFAKTCLQKLEYRRELNWLWNNLDAD